MRPSFVSYSPADGYNFALQLSDDLTAGPPPFKTWPDKPELQPGDEWDEPIVQAIRECKTPLFVKMAESVATNSVAKLEWTRAVKYKKSIATSRLQRGKELLIRLDNRQFIDFSVNYNQRLARLRPDLQWHHAPEGFLARVDEEGLLANIRPIAVGEI